MLHQQIYDEPSTIFILKSRPSLIELGLSEVYVCSFLNRAQSSASLLLQMFTIECEAVDKISRCNPICLKPVSLWYFLRSATNHPKSKFKVLMIKKSNWPQHCWIQFVLQMMSARVPFPIYTQILSLDSSQCPLSKHVAPQYEITNHEFILEAFRRIHTINICSKGRVATPGWWFSVRRT